MSFDPKNIVVSTSYTDKTADIIENVNDELEANDDLLVGDVIHDSDLVNLLEEEGTLSVNWAFNGTFDTRDYDY